MLRATVIFLALIQFITSKTVVINFYDSNETDEVQTKVDPPVHTDYAKMARWLVHNSEWMSMGTISTLPQIQGTIFEIGVID
jgi:hypothetical protein